MTHETDVQRAQTALTVLAVPCGLLLIPFVEPPTQWWVGGDRWSGDWWPTILAGGLFLAFLVLLTVTPLRTFFGLVPLRPETYGILAGIAVAWTLILRFSWRARLLERFLGVELDAPPL